MLASVFLCAGTTGAMIVSDLFPSLFKTFNLLAPEFGI